MLTVEENQWNFKALSAFSCFNMIPFEMNAETGKLQKQSNKFRVILWKGSFCLGIFHLLYILSRLIESVVAREKGSLFRWEHFVIHFLVGVGYAIFYFMGFCMFWKKPEECVIIFNHLFVERENPVEKMVDEEEKENDIKIKLELELKNQQAQEIRDTKSEAEESDSTLILSARNPNPVSSPKMQEKTKSNVRPLFAWPPQYSRNELLARTFFFSVMMTGVFLLIIYVVDGTRPQLLHTFLPPEYQNIWNFLLLLAIEAIFLTFICFTGYFSTVVQLLFFGRCQLEFEQLDLQLRTLQEKFQNRPLQNRDILREMWILGQISSEMRELVVFIALFNRCFPFCVFAFKIYCLSSSILFYFFTIRHYVDFPLLIYFTGYVAALLTIQYSVLYEQAFSIPEKMERLKKKFLLAAKKSASTPISISKSKLDSCIQNRNANLWWEMTREMKRIQNIGIKVGHFHQMERESTPNFIDFVLKNFVNLLVTFPR